ncbi:MAG: hypothetical protein AUG48_02775 [Actinobacteria bacterium 13_1_20CM_3_68_9]|nr:MAG: hypothetical protein AUG48_02775 [Actinobacteria bacterium 13_1_20CM_3_68_9]
MDLDAYVAEHAGQWRRLEDLARRRKLDPAEADELVSLYQRAATHLSVVRSRSPDPALVAKLSRIVLTARGAITGGSAFSWRTVGRFFTHTFPLAVYEAWAWWSAVAVANTALALLMMYYVAGHPDVQAAFLSDDKIQQIVNSDFAGYYSENQAQNFALEVWTHNALLTGQCLVAGVLVLPVLYLLAMNLFNLGLIGGVMIGNGRSDVFFGLIIPHGLLELTAVFIAAGVGLRIGWAWIAPGPGRTRGRALAQTARSGMLVALGLVGVLAVSGLLEAFVTPSPLPTILRIAIGVLVWGAFLAYVVVLGRRAQLEAVTTDLDPALNEAVTTAGC